MATTALSHTDRSVAELRASKSKVSDDCILMHVRMMEKVAAENGGAIPSHGWLQDHKYGTAYQVMLDYPAAFAHIPRALDRKFEIYRSHNEAKPVVLPPVKPRTLAEYDVTGAFFNPSELSLQEGLTEQEWMQIGRAISHVGESTRWWVGDLLIYGFRQYGKRVSYDLAQQATAFKRSLLYICCYVANRFPPARRVSALTFAHHYAVVSLPPEVADRLLAEAVELGLTTRQLAELGAEECGREKKPQCELEKVAVLLPHITYEMLKNRAGRVPLPHFIASICEEWLMGKPVERLANGCKTQAWLAEMKELSELEGL